MKIAFVCKYNRFRSQIAETYFDQLNKNKSIKLYSAGVIKGWPIAKTTKKVAKELGINLKGKTKTLNEDLLVSLDLIIVVADNVPGNLFKGRVKKVIVWKIKDANQSNEKEIAKVIKQIKPKVEKLVKQLNKENKGK